MGPFDFFIMKTYKHRAGFTLIELLIAIAVFVVMAAMAYGGLSSVIRRY